MGIAANVIDSLIPFQRAALPISLKITPASTGYINLS